MRTVSLPSSVPRPLAVRLGLLCALLFLQVESVEIFVREYFDDTNTVGSAWSPLLGVRLYILSFVVVFPAALLLFCWRRLAGYGAELLDCAGGHRWQPWLAWQLLLFAAFATLTVQLSLYPQRFAGHTSPGLLVWALLLAGLGYCWLLAVASPRFWRHCLSQEKAVLVLAAAVAIVSVSFTLLLRVHGSELAHAALRGTEVLISLFYEDVVFDLASRRIGTSDFSVRVSNECSGFEGIALMTVFLSVYLGLFWREFRFPRVLLAFPLGLGIIWLFNVLRITALIAVGDGVSADVALAGFHSNAGWIAFLVVTIGLLILLHRLPWFAQGAPAAPGASIATVDDPASGGPDGRSALPSPDADRHSVSPGR